MQKSKERAKEEWKTIQPQKKVTFYGPVVCTRGEKLRPVRVDTTTRRLKQVLPSSTSPSIFNQSSQVNRKPKHDNRSKGVEVFRPHSKISVAGSQLKTRLSCNHARPKCQCPSTSANKGKLIKSKHKPMVTDIRGSSHILTSTCTVPRGGVDGRKLYATADGKDGLSIMDANWRPSQLLFKKDAIKESSNDIHASVSSSCESKLKKCSSEDNAKKKVQFSEGTPSIIESDIQDGAEFDARRVGDILENAEEKHESHQTDKRVRNDSSVLPERNYNYGNTASESQSCDDYSENVDDYDSTSSVSEVCHRVKEIHQESCKLCESPKFRHPTRLRLKRMNSASDFTSHPCLRKSNSNTINISPFRRSYNDDVCTMCRRFSRRSHSLEDGHCCCDTSDLDSSDAGYCYRHPRMQRKFCSRKATPKKLPTPAFTSDGEEEILLRDHIPYEPKTELVKDLKKKLEREYRHQDYLHNLVHHRRKLKSWDAEDLDEVRRYRLQRSERYRDWDYGPPHKCVHHYLQNDRLYFEPTITDQQGRSRCAECGACQPTDPKEEPYLYHFTLGGLKKTDVKDMQSSDKENDRKYYQQTERVNHIRKTPGDTSKHVFAKLNHNIDNIFPGRSTLHLRPRAADHLRYQSPSHGKRHPNKSMALVDHLL